MTESITYATRRDRRRAARKTLAGAHTASAGRASAAVLAASGLVITGGVAANASAVGDEGRESATTQVNTSDLNVERASAVVAEPIAAAPDIELSFDRPAVSSEAAPEPPPAPAPEPVVEATPASQAAQQPAQGPDPQQTHQHSHPAEQPAQSEPDPQHSHPSQQTHQHNHQAEQRAQNQPDPQRGDTQQAAEPAQQPQTQEPTQSTQQSQAQSQPAQQESRQSSQSSNGASPASGNQERPANSGSNNSVVSAAYAAIGTPYKWGGNTTSGFDCSGLINWAYNQAGQGGLPRTTYGMDASLPRVSSPQPGDIVLANNNGHGGIYVGNGQVISATASGGVRLHGMNESWHQVNAILRPGS